jgi:hypothetical protein
VSTVSAFAHFRARPSFGLILESLRGITSSQIRGAAWFGLGVWVFTLLIEINSVLVFARTIPWYVLISRTLVVFQLQAFCLLGALVIADRAIDAGASRRMAYMVAAFGGCLAGILVNFTVFAWAWLAFVWPEAWPPPTRPWTRAGTLYYGPIYELTSWLLIGGSAVFLYADWRAARKTEAHLHAAELDRIRRSKRALESRLQAMQARVEPQFLFNTLGHVECLYEREPAQAGRMLDDLIAYLRAAMPHMRDTSSTIAQEMDLARAYLDIIRLRWGNRLQFAIDVTPRTGDVRMPPMMLLPLLDRSIGDRIEPSGADQAITIRADAHDGRLRVTIFHRGAAFADDASGDGMASIRERLAALYGANASLQLRRTDACATEVVLDIPLEPRHAMSQGDT